MMHVRMLATTVRRKRSQTGLATSITQRHAQWIQSHLVTPHMVAPHLVHPHALITPTTTRGGGGGEVVEVGEMQGCPKTPCMLVE